MDEETKKKLKELEDRLDKLETKRIFQQDLMPQVVKFRNLDWVEINLQGPILIDVTTKLRRKIISTNGTLSTIAT
jgi:hypothetical protein